MDQTVATSEQVLELLSNYFDASEGEECDFSKI